jgi:AcrR family transcriptional regulator
MNQVLNSQRKAPRNGPRAAKKTFRKQPVQARSQATVDAILRATARILIRDGYDLLNTNRVAELAGVSVGSLYQYFPGKEALVGALLDHHVERTLAQIRREIPQLTFLPLEQAVPRFVQLMIESHRVDPELHRVFVEQLPRVGDFAKIEAAVEESMVLARAYLEAHKHEIAPKDLEIAAFITVNTIEALTHAAVLSRPDLLHGTRLRDQIAAMVVGYLKGAAS